jgi:hypothetical protein
MKKEEKVIMNQALMMAKAALKTAIDVLEEERDENCLSAKIRSTDEGNEIAGVLYQLFPQKNWWISGNGSASTAASGRK